MQLSSHILYPVLLNKKKAEPQYLYVVYLCILMKQGPVPKSLTAGSVVESIY